MTRPLFTIGLFAVLVAAPSAALAQDAQDWLRLTSAATSEINAADPNPDEAFFNVKGAPPTIIFIVDTSGSMQELVVKSNPISRSTDSGTCEVEDYNGALDAGGFKMTGNYPPPADYPNLFQQSRFYIKTGTGTAAVNGLDTSTYDGVNNLSTNTSTSVEAACKKFRSNQQSNCETCLKTRGYFLGHSSGTTKQDVFSGKFLNFYPPKFVTAREVLKKVITDTEGVRIGLARFNTGASGGWMLQPPKPQCTAALNPESLDWEKGRQDLITQVNNLTFTGGTPLAEALFDVGTYFVEDITKLRGWFGSAWNRRSTFTPPAINSEDRTICYGCQVSAAILISDGVPSGQGNVPQAVKDMNITCSGTGCNNQYLDDVAAFFYQHDLQDDLPSGAGWVASGMQRMSTYTIGFGIQLPIMGSAASVAGGTYQEANDGTSLSTAITSIINDINRRSTTAGSTSIASLQATGETTTLVPRFRPGADDAQWKGFLYRFGLVNELTNECVATGDPSNPGPNDIDKDGFCNSLAYVDADEDIVVEDPVSGDFVKQHNGNPAVPYWEAGGKMVQSGDAPYDPDGNVDTTAASRRNLWTAVPSSDGGWKMVPFHPSEAGNLMHLMGLADDVRADPTCREIATRLGEAEDLETELETWGKTCAEIIISYFRGEQATHKDPDARKLPRDWLLADIFHSSPIVVEAPILPESCANFPSQCVASLWVGEGDFSKPGARESYVDFVQGDHCGVDGDEPCERRRSIALVGSNGGFLHAFDMGIPQKEKLTDNKSNRDMLTGRLPMEGPGTGVELWGFMPPDLLGNLKQGMRGHTYMVDGTAMVREVWVDGSGSSAADGAKDADEFRTVAVVGTGSGGSHYFALDLTQSVHLPNVESLRTQGTEPKLLWLWPEPGSPRVADMGQTFSNFFPRPPPIGPVLLHSDRSYAFPFEFDDLQEDGDDAFTRQSVPAEERWIVGLNGGVDPNLQRGRGFALVDVWTGKTVWDQFWDPKATDVRKDMHHPIPAGLAMMDIGSAQLTAEPPFDGYFDTLTVGDMGGNLWVARMHRPGITNEDGLVVDGWFTARAFQTEKGDGDSQRNRRPITYLTSNALQRTTGYMRTFFGTGDRGSLLDPTTGQCSLGNLQACVAMGCNVRVDEWRDQLPVTEYRSSHWSNGKLESSTLTSGGACMNANCIQNKVRSCVSGCTETSCTAASGDQAAAGRSACIARARDSGSCTATCDGTNALNMGMTSVVSVSKCDPTPSHTPMARAIDSSCGLRTVTVLVPDELDPEQMTQFTYDTQVCGSVVLKNDAAFVVTHDAESDAAKLRHRFVGVHTYGGNGARFFATQGSAASFDAARLSEAQLKYLGTRSNSSTEVADPSSSGWYINYDLVNERTASPAGMAASLTGDSLCVVWNSLVPGDEGAVCGGPGQQEAHMIQADFATGSATCLQDFLPGQRSESRSVIAAPPEPTPATVVGAGSITSGFVRSEPGETPRFIRGFTNADPLQPIYQLELSHQEHQCRHTANTPACGI